MREAKQITKHITVQQEAETLALCMQLILNLTYSCDREKVVKQLAYYFCARTW